VSQKKQDTLLLPITLTNVDRLPRSFQKMAVKQVSYSSSAYSHTHTQTDRETDTQTDLNTETAWKK